MIELDARSLTYDEFRDRCLIPNLPAIIRHAGGATPNDFNMAALRELLSPVGLHQTFGPSHMMPVYPNTSDVGERVKDQPSCQAVEEREGEEGECRSLTLTELLEEWSRSSATGTSTVCYLKDWHLQQEVAARPKESATKSGKCCPAGDGVDGLYHPPSYLGDDWMHAFCVACATNPASTADPSSIPTSFHGFGDEMSDYRFAYIGPPGTRTGLHYDVFGTYSWSFNGSGMKRWFFPTSEGNNYLLIHRHRGWPSPPDLRVVSGIELECVEQHTGDLVFVPARFYHQVHNISGLRCPLSLEGQQEVELTVAINHNWANQYNLNTMVDLFLEDVDTLLAMVSADDLEALLGPHPALWRDHVELLLQRGANWSFSSLLAFLRFTRAREIVAADATVAAKLDAAITRVESVREGLFLHHK